MVLESKANVLVKVETNLINQFCGDTPLQRAAFILPRVTLAGKYLMIHMQRLQLQTFSY